MENPSGFIWLASYPKSGNTWVRCLLEAYRNDGHVDINDLRLTYGDGVASMIRAASPLTQEMLGERGSYLVRPAGLLHAQSQWHDPKLVKTHFANLAPKGLPSFIPPEFTKKAVYIVRDPRSVIMSFAKFYGWPLEQGVRKMGSIETTIGGDAEGKFQKCQISSWSNHVSSWIKEERYPIHVVRYEDLLDDPVSELKDLLGFIDYFEWDEDRAKRAVAACELSKLKKVEEEKGFRENTMSEVRGSFFNAGGTRWKDELGPRWVREIEEDHGDVMKALGYELTLEANNNLKVVAND